MPILKKTVQQFCNILPIGLLQKISPINLYLPYHHLVSDEPAPHIQHLYPFKNVSQFENDLDYLLKYFKPVTLQEVTSHIKSGSPNLKNSFLLTFDDGLKEIYTVVAPILQRKGIPAVFFLNNDFIDNKILFYRLKISLLIGEVLNEEGSISLRNTYANLLGLTDNSSHSLIRALKDIRQNQSDKLDKIAEAINFSFTDFLRNHQPFLTTEQIHSLIKSGFSIGGHSLNHPYYPLLTEEEQFRQTVESVSDLHSRFQLKEKVFAFPHSDVELSHALMEKLMQTDIDLFFGIQNQKKEKDLRILHRFNAERPSVTLQKQIKSVMAYGTLLSAFGKFGVYRQ